ncbi:uncharacterized protein SPPG_05955 [Spizellomyces punctatus DAOM BR117]|uniref:Uncharacterized protein n=1 Tax=Spizellomyces punctatus (strain DAOM BR117) TaxID=645134 RepID=A0A0L0HBN6_SPIPD|nr:uncharacterized protein SPPG_05955 [Spizellomyces punctatus DAOM BR117]KNC99005.1 hypothetical protein SPPG_05955 [Spizellomyces punctatus DAOM BR117]|eukprot:XP_016607045.1 hypothetical protein SPPG_05955 [Spizellomyces punctatus DAOM BR117]
MHDVQPNPHLLQEGRILSLFDPCELQHLPACFRRAAEKAEHTDIVRKQLRVLQRGRQSILSVTDVPTTEIPRSVMRKKFRKMLGQSGYQQLALKPLARVDKDMLGKNPISQAPPTAAESSIRVTEGMGTINSHLKRMVAEMENVTWLPPDARESLENTLIIELAARYNQVQDFITSKLTPAQNRIVAISVISHIGMVKDDVLRSCRRKKEKMEHASIFDQTVNSGRLRAFFRTELNRRIDTEKIMKEALADTEGGQTLHDTSLLRPGDPLKVEVQEMKDALERVTHAIPKLEAPVVTGKHQTELIRRSMRQSSISAASNEPNDIQKLLRRSSRRSSAHLELRRKTLVPVNGHRPSLLSEEIVEFPSTTHINKGRIWELSVEGADDDEESFDDLSYPEDDAQDCAALCLAEGDNPLLQGHTGLSTFRRQMDLKEEISVPRTRYLPLSKYRKRHLTDFDYSMFDTVSLPPSPPSEKNAPSAVKMFEEEKKIMRPVQSHVSERIPKGFITLATEPAAAVSEFGSDVNNNMLNSIDEKLTRYKEVEELYDEIMKTLDQSHLEPDDLAPEDSFACPAAPIDVEGPVNYAWQGLTDPALIRPLFHAKPAAAAPTTTSSTGGRASVPAVRLRTREDAKRPSIPADEYIRNREAAMRKTISSRYDGAFQYNYGGYIPFDVEKRSRQAFSDIGFQDYLEFLRTKTTDFVFDLLYKEDENVEALRRAQEEAEAAARAEEERKKIENERRERAEKRRQMLSYSRGEWNPKILDFMEELHNAAFTSQPAPSDQEPVDVPPMNNAIVKDDKEDGFSRELVTASLPERSKTPTTPKTADIKHSAGRPDSVDIHRMQNELEALWVTLKMPADQKLDMAIKYGGHRFAPKLETAIRLWKIASEHIIARESVLHEIEAFERTASDPLRFFRKGYEGSSEARLKEAAEREQLMRRLHYIEARITDVTSSIKNELHESVTYAGVPYREKMKSDYTDLVRRLQKERTQKREKDQESDEARISESVESHRLAEGTDGGADS